MKTCERKPLFRSASTVFVLPACLVLAACGVSSPATPLPSIDHTRPASLLNAKQKAKALQEMDKIAASQNERAAKVEPITYRIPDSAH